MKSTATASEQPWVPLGAAPLSSASSIPRLPRRKGRRASNVDTPRSSGPRGAERRGGPQRPRRRAADRPRVRATASMRRARRLHAAGRREGSTAAAEAPVPREIEEMRLAQPSRHTIASHFEVVKCVAFCQSAHLLAGLLGLLG